MNYPLTFTLAELELRRMRGYSSEYLIHQLVADLVPDSDERGYLFRVTARAPREATALVLSDEVPLDAPPERPWGRTRRVRRKRYDPQLSADTLLDYEIRLNATRTVTLPDGKKKRRDIWDAVFEADREDARSPHDVYGAYLQRKLQGVAEVLEARVTERGQVRARRPGRRPITFVATNVAGTLRVVEPEGFRRTIAAGLGRAKAFGCGLLCLSRPGTILARRQLGGLPIP